MRKPFAIFATVALTGLSALLPTTSAHASTACDNAWAGATSGYFYAYSNANCSGFLGKAAGDDSNWGDSSASFQGSDTNSASSVLTRGTSGLAVALYNGTGTGWGGGYTCLRKSEYYASNLSDNTFTSGAGVDNAISSHRWVSESACYGHFLT